MCPTKKLRLHIFLWNKKNIISYLTNCSIQYLKQMQFIAKSLEDLSVHWILREPVRILWESFMPCYMFLQEPILCANFPQRHLNCLGGSCNSSSDNKRMGCRGASLLHWCHTKMYNVINNSLALFLDGLLQNVNLSVPWKHKFHWLTSQSSLI